MEVVISVGQMDIALGEPDVTLEKVRVLAAEVQRCWFYLSYGQRGVTLRMWPSMPQPPMRAFSLRRPS